MFEPKDALLEALELEVEELSFIQATLFEFRIKLTLVI